MAEETLMVFQNFGLKIADESFEINEICLLGDEHPMEFGHVHDAELQRGRLIVAKETAIQQGIARGSFSSMISSFAHGVAT